MTKFQSECYEALKKVPKGNLITNAGLAGEMGKPKAYQAVGNEVNKNPLAPKVLCQWVVK